MPQGQYGKIIYNQKPIDSLWFGVIVWGGAWYGVWGG